MIKVCKYKISDKELWNDFVSSAKNATFLFNRDFMEYHKDRFEDYSLLCFDKEKLVALLPANIQGGIVYSHQGLTYGGIVIQKQIPFFVFMDIYKSLISFLKTNKIEQFKFKLMPIFYCKSPSNELSFALGEANSKLYKRNKVFAIDYSKELTIHKTKIKHFRKGVKLGLKIKEEANLDLFWNKILIPLLDRKYKSKPVHDLYEINALKRSFPSNIKQFNVYLEGEVLGGITIFETEEVVKSQYAASTPSGEKTRALDFLFISLINRYKAAGKHFFSMGTVADNSDKGYNEGLVKQKEELGVSIYVQDFYNLKVK